jgi:hypothetical protein
MLFRPSRPGTPLDLTTKHTKKAHKILWLGLRQFCDLCIERSAGLVFLVDEKRMRFLKHLVELRGRHLSNWVKNDVVFNG